MAQHTTPDHAPATDTASHTHPQQPSGKDACSSTLVVSLQQAAERGDVQGAQAVLACANGKLERADVQTALLTACKAGHAEVVTVLLHGAAAAGLDLAICFPVAFSAACQFGRGGAAAALLAHGDPRDMRLDTTDLRSTLLVSCARGFSDVVPLLLALPFPVLHSRELMQRAFQVACENGKVGVMRHLLGVRGANAVEVHDPDRHFLARAVSRGVVEAVAELLALQGDRRLDIYVNGAIFVREACLQGNSELLQLLLGLTGDRYIYDPVYFSLTLTDACERGREACVRQLLQLTGKRRVMPRTGRDGALHEAAAHGHIGVVRALLELCRDDQLPPHSIGEDGLVAACELGHLPVVQELLRLAGARGAAVHASVDAAFQRACIRERLPVVAHLLALEGHRGPSAAVVRATACGETPALRVRRDVMWAGAAGRHPRKSMVLLRVARL